MNEEWLLGIEIGGTKLQLGLGRVGAGLEMLERRRVDPARGATGDPGPDSRGIRVAPRRTSLSCAPGSRPSASVSVGRWTWAAGGRRGPTRSRAGTISRWPTGSAGSSGSRPWKSRTTPTRPDSRRPASGRGSAVRPILYLTIGSGIGGALIIDGRIYRGAGLGAVEIGHLQVPDLTQSPTPILELEQIASGWGIGNRARVVAQDLIDRGVRDWAVLREARGDVAEISAELVARAAAHGDVRSLEILDRAHRAVAYALRQAIALVAPRRIILGGGVSLIGEAFWFGPIRKLVDGEVFAPFRGSFDIVPASLGEEVVVHGARALAGNVAGHPR